MKLILRRILNFSELTKAASMVIEASAKLVEKGSRALTIRGNTFQENKERELGRQRERRKELAYRIGWGMPGRKWIPISIKRALVERANGQCERMDSSCKGGLTIHHVDRNPENNELSNLELICMGHAAQEHELYALGLRARGGSTPIKA